MTTANHLINALAAQDKDGANTAFEAVIQDRLADYLEVRKVELASTIMDDLQEGSGAARQYVRQVGAMMKASPAITGGPGRSINRGELKAHAAKLVRKLGPDMVKHHADTIKGARVGAKIRAKVDAMKEETLEEGGPTRKHFQQTADLIKQIEHPEKRKEMANHHASLFAQQNPRFDKAKFMAAAGVNEALEAGSKTAPASTAQLNKNVLQNIRTAARTLKVAGVNPTMAAAAHRDFGKLAAKNPKAPGYMLMRKLSAQKAQSIQSLTTAGVPLGQSLEAHPTEFNQAIQRIKRFK